MKTAIVAVHGVIPHPRYGFQDEVATALRDRLNGFTGDGVPLRPRREQSRRGSGPRGDAPPRGTEAGKWRMDIVFPGVADGPASVKDPVAAERPSIVRVYQNGDDVAAPAHDCYDVIEAYWSPIDKNKTNAVSVLKWLIETIFLPANSTARYTGWPIKGISDAVYVLGFAAVAVLAFAVCIVAVTNALHEVIASVDKPLPSAPPWWTPFVTALEAVKAHPVGHWYGDFTSWVRAAVPNFGATVQVLWNPDNFVKLLGPEALLRLALGAVGAFLLAQGMRAWHSIARARAALAHVAMQLRWRRVFTAILLLGGLALLLLCACWPTSKNVQLGPVAVALVIAALAFEALRTVVQTFLAQFFGDVQIYCTHDENAEYFALRTAILNLVERTIVETIKSEEYERVHIFAHSLGSTISLDALLRIYNLREEHGIAHAAWQRVRSFVTFGSSLEKTRFFLDAYGVSFSATLEEWRGDYYGALFTPKASVLDAPNADSNGIYWANYWFFLDFISDRIGSYRSFLTPTDSMSHSSDIRADVRTRVAELNADKKMPQQEAVGKLVAQNRVSYRLPTKPWLVLHGDYLTSRWFWLDDVESRAPWAPWSFRAPRPETASEDAATGVLDIVTRRAPPPKAFAAPATVGSVPALRDVTDAVRDEPLETRRAKVDVKDRFVPFRAGGAASANIVDVVQGPPR